MSEYKGGLLWGSNLFNRINVTYPFAKLVVRDKSILLYSPKGEFHLSPDKVIKISEKNRIIYKGIAFYHKDNSLPKILVFWTFQGKEIMEDINQYFLNNSGNNPQ